MAWNYDPSKFSPNAQNEYELIPEGEYTVKIQNAEQTMSRQGNDMIKVTYAVSGRNNKLFGFFVNGPYLQQKLDRFFPAFGIDPRTGLDDIPGWAGLIGRVKVSHKQGNDGRMWAELRYISRDKMAKTQQASPKQDVGSLRNEPGFEEDFPLDFSDIDNSFTAKPKTNEVEVPF